MNSLPSEYAGQCVAFVEEKIVAAGKNSLEAYNKAKKLHPHKMVSLMYVPTKRELVTFL